MPNKLTINGERIITFRPYATNAKQTDCFNFSYSDMFFDAVVEEPAAVDARPLKQHQQKSMMAWFVCTRLLCRNIYYCINVMIFQRIIMISGYVQINPFNIVWCTCRHERGLRSTGRKHGPLSQNQTWESATTTLIMHLHIKSSIVISAC